MVMASIPILLGTFSWPTRSAAEAAFRAILRDSGYSVGVAISDPVHHRMLIELLERHPDHAEKTGPGVKEFFIDRARDASGVFVGANPIGIWIRRVDGEAVDFSYLTAVRQHPLKSHAKERCGRKWTNGDRSTGKRVSLRAKKCEATSLGNGLTVLRTPRSSTRIRPGDSSLFDSPQARAAGAK
ncbi:DCL family protein [Clavibacter michiganensis subsp. insidiosus]